MLQINKTYLLDDNNQPIAVQISLAEFEQIEEILENYELSNNQLNLSSTPTIEEMLNQLAKIQQENPVYLESIERVDRVNEILRDQ